METTKIKDHLYAFKHPLHMGTSYTFVCAECKQSITRTFSKTGVRKTICSSCDTIYVAKVVLPVSVSKTGQGENKKPLPSPTSLPTNPTGHDSKTSTNKTIVFTPSSSGQQKISDLSLVWGGRLGGLIHPQTKPLCQGVNIIGRKDTQMPSDISIDDDYISRRSIEIVVAKAPGNHGFSYRMKVLTTSNPVYLNGKEIKTGQQVFLQPTDKIKIGKTTLTFKSNKK